MEFTLEPINGVCIGAEYIPAHEVEQQEDEEWNTFLIDIFIFRVIIQW